MPANECIPYASPGTSLTAKASGAIKGKRFVVVSANRTGGGGGGAEGSLAIGVGLSADVENVYVVKQAGAKGAIFGVAGWDAADKAELKVYTEPGVVVPVVAGAGIAAGVEVESDAEGRAITLAAGKAVGYCLNGAAEGKDAEIKLY